MDAQDFLKLPIGATFQWGKMSTWKVLKRSPSKMAVYAENTFSRDRNWFLMSQAHHAVLLENNQTKA